MSSIIKIFNKNMIDWKLLSKHLAGETSAEENNKIGEWIKGRDKNKILYEDIQSDWEKINETIKMKKVDVNKAWDNLKDRIIREEPGLEDITVFKPDIYEKYFYRTLRIAASIILLIGVSFGAYKIYFKAPVFDKQNTIVSSGSENTSIIVLPDGSKIFLNSNTYIRYANKFGTDNRAVYLKGEAYFEVVRNTKLPFIINTNKASVKVLGTTFNVNTGISGKQVEVFVESGKVQLNRKNKNENNIFIEPGYIGILSKNTLTKSRNTDTNYLAWKTRYLVFRDTKLEAVAKTLGNIYNTSIVFENEETANCRLTTTFNNQSLDSIMKVIKKTFNLEKIVKTRKGIIIIGQGCQ